MSMSMLRLSRAWHGWIVAIRNKIAMGCQLGWSLNAKPALTGDVTLLSNVKKRFLHMSGFDVQSPTGVYWSKRNFHQKLLTLALPNNSFYIFYNYKIKIIN